MTATKIKPGSFAEFVYTLGQEDPRMSAAAMWERIERSKFKNKITYRTMLVLRSQLGINQNGKGKRPPPAPVTPPTAPPAALAPSVVRAAPKPISESEHTFARAVMRIGVDRARELLDRLVERAGDL